MQQKPDKIMQQSIILNLPQSPRMVDILRYGLTNSNKVVLCVSFLRFSGLNLLTKELNTFLERQGKIQLLTSTYLNITQPEALEALMRFEEIDLRIQNGDLGFHTKFYLFNNSDNRPYCWIGSSNLTKGGIAANIEWNLKHTDPRIIQECQSSFYKLWTREDVFPLDRKVLEKYREQYKKSKENSNFIYHFNRSEVYKPNPAQLEALKGLRSIRDKGYKKAVVIAATGLGKTFLAAFDSRAIDAKNVLFIAHREELLNQAEATYKKVFGREIITGILAGRRHPEEANFVFATIQSLSQVKNRELIERTYDYVVIDEFHHAAASSYQKILNTVQPKFLLGLTATPERQDGHDVLKVCEYNIAYEVRLPEAINRSWLIPFHYFGIADELVDYKNINWRSGKFDPKELENALILEDRVDEILKHALEKGFDGNKRATIGFCAGVRHAKFMADKFNQKGYISAAVTGKIKPEERQKIYARFIDPNDPLEWLFVADVLNEGIDIPEINSILFLRPTESSILFLQQLGRGLRPHPDIEVLTVIDFVGHHKNAWLSLSALNDPHRTLGSQSTDNLDIVPPKNCEIVLEDKTKEILIKIRSIASSKADFCKEAYGKLKVELGYPPKPIDLAIRDDMPSMKEIKQAFGSWLDFRVSMGDATDWEINAREISVVYNFLKTCERDWQAQRVSPYALLWAVCHHPNDISKGFEEFFIKFPHWLTEKPEHLDHKKLFTILTKKLSSFLSENNFIDEIDAELKSSKEFSQNIEDRIIYTLHKDYALRHCGALRHPEDLTLYGQYKRPEIINYFGVQYDPTKHNSGVIKLPNNNIVLLTKMNTSGAKEEFQYQNHFLDDCHFSWQSQNKQRQDNESGKEITEHKKRKNMLHLFIQPSSHKEAYYIGTVNVISVVNNAPMTVSFRLSQSVPISVLESLSQT